MPESSHATTVEASATTRLRSLGAFSGTRNELFGELSREVRATIDARSTAVIGVEPRSTRLLACDPMFAQDEPPPSWVRQAMELVREVDLSSGPAFRSATSDGLMSSDRMVIAPLHPAGPALALVALLPPHVDGDRCLAVLELVPLILDRAKDRAELVEQRTRNEALVDCLDLQSSLNTHKKFRGASMACCNEIAARWSAERVSLGLTSGRYVRVRAMNQTERIDRRSNLVRDVELAMEECLDQDLESYPPSHPSDAFVNRAARQLAERHGPAAVCSFPLRIAGEPVGVLTVERPADRPLTVEEVGRLRVACDLCTPRLHELSRHDRWIGARLAAGLKRTAAATVGPRHTWAKLLAIALLGLLLFSVFGKGAYRVESPFVVETRVKRIVPAPFEGFLEQANVEPGDETVAGQTVLAQLETSELRLELARQRAARVQHLKEADVARRDRDESAVQIARAQADAAAAEIAWLEQRLERATIVAPIDGVVLQGELQKRLGSPVQRGEALFELAPLESLCAMLRVPDNRIDEISIGQRGELAAASHPGDKIGFEVEYIHPVAEVIDGANVFRVRVKLDDAPAWLAPGVEGLAKSHVGERSHLYIWTRDAINWVRMSLWL